jgi:hypothetical protein
MGKMPEEVAESLFFPWDGVNETAVLLAMQRHYDAPLA